MHSDRTPHSKPLSYQPSVFYFRRDLRTSASIPEAINVALTVVGEFERLREWSAQHGVLPSSNVHVGADLLRESMRNSTSHVQIIVLGLYVCHELEELKQMVRNAGLIPPKWEVAPDEAREKGWVLEDRADDDAVNW